MDNKEIRMINQEELETAISLIECCSDDYLFFFDFDNDCYGISEAAVKKFNLPGVKFKNVYDVFRSIIFEDDIQMVSDELQLLRLGCKNSYHMELRWKDKNGKIVWVSSKGELLHRGNHKANILFGNISEIGNRQKADNATGLRTEIQFIEDYEKYRENGIDQCGFVMALGVDNIDWMNEKYGRSASDEIIKRISNCIQNIINDSMKVYWTTQNQFILFGYDCNQINISFLLFKRLKEVIDEEECNSKGIFFTMKAGVVLLDNKFPPYSELRKQLDFSFLAARSEGENDLFIFNDSAYEKHIQRLDMQEELRADVKNNFRGFHVYYQPIVNGETYLVQGAEALLRWENPKYGYVPPIDFIPILEETGLIVPVGRWIMRNAINACKAWQQHIPKFHVNINLSYIQLKQGDIVSDVIQDLKFYELESKYVLLELTESGHVETNDSIRQVIRHLHKKKVKLGIDDFGTGYSNLTYLQELKVYIIKIDRTFVEKAIKSHFHYKLLEHVIEMAHGVHLKVCMEGIETDEELQKIKVLGADYYQGYYFGRPVDTNTFLEQNIKKTV